MKIIKASLALVLLCSSVVNAEQWKILGPRPLGMGGAFVAVAKGPIAQYWNPAGLAQEENVSGVEIAGGGRAEFTGGILKDANALGDLVDKYKSVQSAQQNGGAINAEQMAAVVKGIATISDMNQAGKGLIADVEGGVNFKFSKVAISVNNFSSAGASPFVDVARIGLGASSGLTGISLSGTTTDPAAANLTSRDKIDSAITTIGAANVFNMICGAATCNGIGTSQALANALVNQAVTNGLSSAQIQSAADTMQANASNAAPVIKNLTDPTLSYTNNQSNLTLRGGSFTELAFGYAKQAFVPGLSIGGNLKAIFGAVGYTKFNMLQNDAGTTDALKKYNDNTQSSVRPAVDLGALWEVNKLYSGIPFNPRVGVVFRNVNSPKFDQPKLAIDSGDSSKYAYNSQLRGGVAISPLHFWTLAADMDLTKNETAIPGYKSRQLSLGTEINIFNRPWINIPLRAGLIKNMADSSSKMAYTAGFGINLLHLIIDVGGSISSDKVTLESGEKIYSNAAAAGSIALLF